MKHDFEEDIDFRDDMSYGEFVRKKRRLMGFNQSDFGKMFGVTQNTVSSWEVGKTTPSFDIAVYVITRLGGKVLIKNERWN